MASSQANPPPATPRQRAAVMILLIGLLGAVYLRQRMAQDHTSTVDMSTASTKAKTPWRPPSDWLAACCITIGIVGALYLGWREAQSMNTITVPVIADDLPAYHLITTADLTDTLLLASELPAQTLTTTAKLLGAVSLAPLTAGKPITAGQVLSITDPILTAGTLVTAIEAGPGITFGGQLRSGSIVAAWIENRRVLDRLLVLDVKQFATGNTANLTPRYVIILVVPSNLRSEIIDAAAKGTLSFTLSP